LTTNGRHRFASTSKKHFGELFDLLNRETRLASKLADQGAGGVPTEYLAAVENGLRSHGDDLHAMGTNAMRSEEDWKKVHQWMKREAYIAAARHHWGKPSYSQWDHFLLQDYMDRCKLTVTFLKRHLLHSNGKEFAGVRNPKSWSEPPPEKTTQRQRKSSSKGKTAAPAATNNKTSGSIMMFDAASGKMVPLHDVSSTTESEDDIGWSEEV